MIEIGPQCDVDALLARFALAGCRVYLDGWELMLEGGRPSGPLLQELRRDQYLVLWHLVNTDPHPCPTCGGGGVVEARGSWWCRGHQFQGAPEETRPRGSYLARASARSTK